MVRIIAEFWPKEQWNIGSGLLVSHQFELKQKCEICEYKEIK